MAPARTARRELAVATATTIASSSSPRISTSSANSTSARDCDPSYQSTQSTTPDSCWDNNSSSSSSSDYSDPDTEAESESGSEPDTFEDADDTLEGISDEELGTEGEEIMRDIAECKAKGPAKPKHKDKTTKLWKSEAKIWDRYALMIKSRTKMPPKVLLLAGQPEFYKSYLRWRKRNYPRLKKKSSMESYWKRISQYYRDVAGRRMDANILDDICNWLPTLELDTSEKEKLAMFVTDLSAILYALWIDDKKPLHGLLRIMISLLLLLSAATGMRPSAVIALKFKDINIMKVRGLDNPQRSSIIVCVTFKEVKNKDKGTGGKPKTFTFRLEGLPAFCIVTLFIVVGFCHKAFQDEFSDIQEMFNLTVPIERRALRFRWKQEVLDRPFFADVIHAVGGARIQKETPFPYNKYLTIFQRLGREAGFEHSVHLYQIRRASGRKLNEALSSAERNQIMGHCGNVYERYYMPTDIAHDCQNIYFGTPSEEELIQSVASMSISRDRRAPKELDDKELNEVRNHPDMVALRVERERYKEALYAQGYYPLKAAEGMDLYKKYMNTNSKMSSTYQKLRRERLAAAIREFHNTIDGIEIAKQLRGSAATEVLTLPVVEFELRERATVANMLFKPFPDDKARVRFVRALIKLGSKQETRQPKALKRTMEPCNQDPPSRSKRNQCSFAPSPYALDQEKAAVKKVPTLPLCGTVQEELYPKKLLHPVCLICIGNSGFSRESRLRPWPRKDVLNKHIKAHFKDPEFQAVFSCRHPRCQGVMLDGIMHFKRHALDVHGVTH